MIFRFSDDVNSIVKTVINNCDQIVTPICKQMAEIRNMFDGSF